MKYDGYTELANAIILQAVKDYRHTQSQAVRNEIKRFFLSEWFVQLTNADGKMIIKKLEQERGIKNGKNK